MDTTAGAHPMTAPLVVGRALCLIGLHRWNKRHGLGIIHGFEVWGWAGYCARCGKREGP